MYLRAQNPKHKTHNRQYVLAVLVVLALLAVFAVVAIVGPKYLNILQICFKILGKYLTIFKNISKYLKVFENI